MKLTDLTYFKLRRSAGLGWTVLFVVRVSLFAMSISILSDKAEADGDLEQNRARMTTIEQAIKQQRWAEADSLINQLGEYPLYPYMLYKRIAANPSADSVQSYLNRYPQSRQAITLRAQWLAQLASQGNWVSFEQFYQSTDNLQTQCQHHQARYALGHGNEAFTGVEELWGSGVQLPEACNRILSLWQQTPSFTKELIWQRFGASLQKNNRSLAVSTKALLPKSAEGTANLWLSVHDNPKLILACSGWDLQNPLFAEIFAHGVDRLATTEPLLAQLSWDLRRPTLKLSTDALARIDRRVALSMAAHSVGQAASYLAALPEASVNDQIRTWRVRSALSKLDWSGVLRFLDALTPEEKQQAQWLYWRGRASEELGNRQAALENFRLAAEQRDFYGFSAADRLARPYELSAARNPITSAQVTEFANSPDFRALQELHAIGREGEARSDWLYALKSWSPLQQAYAAKLAQQWGWDQLAIMAAAKAGYWGDLGLRFPLAFTQPVTAAAMQQQLDPAVVMAVIRRESAFDPLAGSSAGALGLMQLMPNTGAQLARQLGETFPGNRSLLNPERNIRYGTTYLHGLLSRFNNHLALAAAAYNAGPNRVLRWLPQSRPMPADVWVESIPYTETRQYVTAVLSYAVIYKTRLAQTETRISNLLPDILPPPDHQEKTDSIPAVALCDRQ